MTTTHTPGAVPGCVSGSVQRTDDPNIHGVAETKAFLQDDQVHRLSSSRPSGCCLRPTWSRRTDGHTDYFQADRAWFYVVLWARLGAPTAQPDKGSSRSYILWTHRCTALYAMAP